MKLLSNKQYNDLINEIKCLENTNNQNIETLMLDNKDFELKIDSIHKKLIDIVVAKDIKKDTIIKNLKKIIRYIERGK